MADRDTGTEASVLEHTHTYQHKLTFHISLARCLASETHLVAFFCLNVSFRPFLTIVEFSLSDKEKKLRAALRQHRSSSTSSFSLSSEYVGFNADLIIFVEGVSSHRRVFCVNLEYNCVPLFSLSTSVSAT